MAYALPLVPTDFSIPENLITSEFKLRMLTIHDVVKDYDAVMTSHEHLQGVFGPNSTWPAADLTLEQDLIDLAWHQKEFQNRTSFAYTVMSLDDTRCLGCVYIYPADPKEYDAQVIFWARQSELSNNLEHRLFDAIKAWCQSSWPFKKVGYPGKDIPWETWSTMSQKTTEKIVHS